jgi:hypothetical protein
MPFGAKGRKYYQISDHAPDTCAFSHLICNTTVFKEEPNFSRIKSAIVSISYSMRSLPHPGHKTGLKVPRVPPGGEIQQKPTAGPTDVPNRISRGSSTDGSTAVASVCVLNGSAGCDWLSVYTYLTVYWLRLRCRTFFILPGISAQNNVSDVWF